MSVASRRTATPEPGPSEQSRGQSTPSGRLLLRMPRSLHGALTDAAERDGTSLNQFITGTLASAIGWNGEDQPRRMRPAAEGGEKRPSRGLLILLVVNAVAVGLAALGAIGILLLAWFG